MSPKRSKEVALAIFDTLTLGIPMTFYYLIKEPKRTLKRAAIIIPLIAAVIWFILSQ